MADTFAQWEANRKAAAGNPDTAAPAPEEDTSGILPSGLSSLGGLLGLAGPAFAVPGAALGSAVNEIRKSVPGVIEMSRHGGGLFGPMGPRPRP